jgi:YVTN family beta-propeller protein
LVDELGLEPGPGLQQLERAILSQDAELAGPAPFDPEPEDDGVDVGRRLPHGTVTLLFTDIEGSTQLQRRLDEGYHEVVTEHWRMLEAAFAEHGGVVVDRQTESFFVVFRRARQASLAAAAAQASLAAHDWPDGVRIKVRMGMHSGDPEVAGDRYVGLAVSRAARICAAAHGGQVLMSSATRSLLTDDGRIILRNLGSHRLKDFDEPEPISQLVIDGLPSQFPPLRTEAASSLRKPLVLIGAGLLVAGAIAAAVVLATGGKSAPIRAVPINSLARIDANTGRLKGSIPVGVRPTAVAVGEGSLWVANFDEQTVSRVDPATRKELTRIPAGGAPTGLAVGGGFVWVTHGFAGTVSQIDPGLNRITATFPVGSSAADVAVVGNAVWIVKKIDGAVLRIDPSTGAIVRTIVVGGNPTSLAADAHSLWIADGRSVLKVDVSKNRVVARIALRHQATRVALGGGAVWVSANLDNVVTRIDIATGSAAVEIPVGKGPVVLAADAKAVWVADGLAGAVSRIDPATNRVVATIPVGRQPAAVALTGGSVWVTVVAL